MNAIHFMAFGRFNILDAALAQGRELREEIIVFAWPEYGHQTMA